MNDKNIVIPLSFSIIKQDSENIHFSMPSDLQTGSLLRTLVTSKPNGSFLELGTGTGLSLSWIVEAMDNHSKVISIDNNDTYLNIAKKHFGTDSRITIICENGIEWIKNNQDQKFDLIFADAWPGKYECLDETLSLLKNGGFYIIDDMLHQPNWPDGHQDNVDTLITYLDSKTDLKLTKLNWSTGLIIVVKMYCA